MFTRKNLIKFVIATAAFYALLAFNVFHVGERLVSTEEVPLKITERAEISLETPEDQYIQEAVEDLQVHQAADAISQDKIRLQAVCALDKILCAKVVFEGIYTDRDRYLYL